MKVIYISLIISTLFTLKLQAQSLPSTVIGASGSYVEDPSVGSLHFTVGELAVARLVNGKELGEGFHRTGFNIIVSTSSPEEREPLFSVYPNPARSHITIATEQTETYQLRLYQANGQLVTAERNEGFKNDLNISELAGGAYWLEIIMETGERSTFSILKVRE